MIGVTLEGSATESKVRELCITQAFTLGDKVLKAREVYGFIKLVQINIDHLTKKRSFKGQLFICILVQRFIICAEVFLVNREGVCQRVKSAYEFVTCTHSV